ncbi:cytochrome P450 714C2-like [Vicia villosa]|uniref:cytochrome P450 714C2-like n=1 Tax=Vicia villosa TaxID=3911 RepID=UPI00273AB9C5|nr:cytochrome P450 714C2-like [Vicia villosa]XP_058745239.1 cytochrome P450 714C2-like [Vicia villosa]
MEIVEISTIMKVLFGAILVILVHILNILVLRPKSLRAKLQRQGINGPSPHFYFGNIPEMKRLVQENNNGVSTSISHHNWHSNLFPYIYEWRKQYGPIFLFSAGSIQWLLVTDIDMVKEIVLYTSLNLGKPSFMSKDNKPLLGKGIISSNGQHWAHQRKIIAPELYQEKMKAKVNMMVDSTNELLRSWDTKLKKDGDGIEIKIDPDVRNLLFDVIAKTCFGSSYVEGREIFTKFRELQNIISKEIAGIPGYRYLPNKTNRQMWKLEKEINSKISKLIKKRQNDARDEQDLLQMILDGAKKCDSGGSILPNSISRDMFIIDNCKNIFFAGYDTTSNAASWCLMLLSMHQDWQDRARAEVLEVVGKDGNVDASMLKSLKMLTMVIQETLRLYPPASSLYREVYEDIVFKGLLVPKGTNIHIPMPILHQDSKLWGDDAHEFNPERFANGVQGACKIPQVYMPFGMGSRICVGQHLAMVELKVMLSLILLKFRFSISPSYRHSPSFHMLIAPGGDGVVVNMTRV